MNYACTLIGGYIGSTNNEVEYTKADNDILNLSADDKIKVIKQNSETVEGTFCGFNKLSVMDYTKSYNSYINMQEKKIFLPDLGEKYSINRLKNPIKFKGFDFGTIYYDSASQVHNKSIPLSNVAYLADSSGQKYARESIQKLLVEKRIPLYSQLVLKNAENTFEIKSEEISKIVTKSGLRFIMGMALGAIVDVFIYFIVKDALSFNFGGGLWGGKK